MINIAICDDTTQICSYIEKIILDYCKKLPKYVSIKIYYSGNTLIEDIRKNKYFDIIFLDIVLDELSGIEVGEKIREELKNFSTQIVYVSAYSHYAMQLFSNMPFGFLVKPFKETDVEEIIERWIRMFYDDTSSFMYKKGTEVYKIEVKNILYFESIGRQIRIVTNTGKDNFYGNIKDTFSELEKFNFIHTHRAYLINYKHVIKARYDSLIMSNSDIIPISQPKRKELRHFFLINNISNNKLINI